MTSFDRGEHPVGVRTVELHDPARDRALTVEVWYPADGALAGADRDPAQRDRYLLLPGFPPSYQHAVRDAAPAPGRRPLIVFSHGLAGHRRQSTFYCTHLASHGYAVIAPDHAGNTFRDLMGGAMPTDAARWADWMRARPADVRFLIDRVADLGLDADAARVGVTGHSFGGWTAIASVAAEPRIAAVVALAPAISNPAMRAALDLAWRRPVPTLVIAAERDSILPLGEVEVGYDLLAAPKQLVTLLGIDHQHFCDAAQQIHELFRALPTPLVPLATPIPPWSELAPARNGHEPACGLGVAHFDHVLRDRPPLDAATTLAARDLPARVR
jgi:predicted dienelactone hydrolase